MNTKTKPRKLELYGGKYSLAFNPTSHRYMVNGQYKHGVTTMLKLLDKGDSLLQWASNMAVEAMLAGLDPMDAKYAYRKKRDDAGDIGKIVHDWIENHVAGNTLPIHDEIKKPVEAYLRWEAERGIEHLEAERVVYSETYDYCGTLDDLHEQSGIRVVNDYKTGKPDFEYDARLKRYTGKVRPRLEHILQCALYDQAIFEEDGVWARKYAVTYVTKEGELYYFETDRVKDFRDLALQVVQTYKILKVTEKLNEFKEQ